MYSTITTTSKQVLVWALMFTLVLSVFPTTVADETDDEWFYSIDEYVSDEDGDGYNDTIDIGYDPDTECDCDINITVYVDVYENGTVIDYLYDEHTINNGEYDWFSQDWTPEESGTFDFQVYMYDEWNNLEDYWNVTGIELEPMTGSADETINVDNMVGDYHDDGINNDMGMFAFVKNDAVEDVEISVEYFNGVIWTYYANGTTDDNGEFLIENATNGEYRWNAEYDGELLEEETVSYTEIDATTNLSHQLTIDDWDDAGDYDDFLAAIFEGNDTKDDGYVEVYDEDGDLYDSGNTDDDYYGYDVYALYDVEEGNYTFNLYYEEDGELLQSGWLHSYGSSSTNYDEWFYDWDYDVYSNDTITIGYDPDTECECDVDITVYVDAYENETGDWAGWTYDEHQIYNGESDWFEQNWTAYENGSYDFYVAMYDENDNFEDEFWIYDVYLESDGGGGGGGNESNDEWFYDWDYDVDPSDTITIGYDPDTECDCNVTIHVYVDIYDNATGDYLDYTYEEHEINNGYYDWFEQSWTADENGSYDFNAIMYDEDWNEEDDFWIYDVSLTSDGGGGGGGNESNDEWFYSWDYDVDPSDTITIGYDPDTECDCDVTIHVYVDIYDNETGEYLDYTYAEHEINNGYGDWFTQNWTAYENGSYDFNAIMYDEDWNEEDDFWIYDVYLTSDDGGGGGGTGDDNGVGHIGIMDDWEEDGFVNDYIGGVIEDDELKDDAYFEIYQDGELVDSGNPNYFGLIFVSYNLTEGWYEQYVYYEEDDALLQTGPFYSYGDSTEFEVVNVDNLVSDENDDAVYDDVGFLAHQGNTSEENGVEGVGIEISKYNHSTEEWDYHAYVETNETGEAWLYNEACGEYEWYASDNNEKGYYEVWAGCDDTGGGNGTEDDDEWFYDWGYDVDPSETITIGYDPDTECDCNVTIYVDIDVYTENGTHIDTVEAEHTIYNGYGDWFTQNWTADEGGTYDFRVNLLDEDYELEDSFWIYNVSLSYEYDEWIHAWIHYVPQDENGNNNWDEIVIGYDPETECDCDVDVSVLLEVYDENGDLAADSQSSHTINGEQEDWFLQELSMNIEPGVYDFYVTMYDEDGNHEEQKYFSLIMSDEWFDYDWAIEDGNVKIDLQGNTNYDGEIDTYYEANVYRWNEDENDWEEIDSLSEDATISSESPAPIHFEWEAEESGDYRFVVYMADGMGQEDSFDFMEEINLNQAPVIEDLNVDHLFEGQLFNFEVLAFDADDDELEYTWDMGDGSPEKDGDSVRYGYQDDGVYTIQVSVSDGEFTTVKEFEMIVENMAPALEVSFDNEADEGSELSFAAQVNDVASDDVTVTWTFADGSRVEGTFAQYTFRDNGEYLVVVVAEDEDGGTTMEQLLVIINNVAPSFTQFVMPSGAEEGQALDFMVSATDPGDDTITYTFNFGDGTAIMMTPDGNISHKFADGDTFTIVICAQDEDGGENCRTETLPVSILEQMEEEGLLPGFGVLGALSALGVIGILRRRTH